LVWTKVTAEGLVGGIGGRFPGESGAELCAATGGQPGDLLLFVAERVAIARRVLGELRVKLGSDSRLGLRDPKQFCFAWVTGFPLFTFDEDRGRWDSTHHPFTAPLDWGLTNYGEDTAAIRSSAYDLVLNGWELGSGSIRIHRRDVQQRVFEFLGIGQEEQEQRFGFLLEALDYGAPPHGGIALGLDRVIALSLGLDNIREVIAFPKTTSAADLMCEAPSRVAPEQLADLHILAQAPVKP
jgi:aspartyl-tRNA synthetase